MTLPLYQCLFFLETFTDLPIKQSKFIVEVLEYLLSHNYFSFDGVFYLQKCGAATGAKFSPSLANLYMRWWERSPIFGGENPFKSSIRLYLRFIDDLLFIMKDGTSTFIPFLEYLNCNNKNLTFTGEVHNDEIH